MTTLGELAKALELELRGDPTRSIDNLAALESATAHDLSFVSEKKHLSKVSDTNAGALILHPDWGRKLVRLRATEPHALCGVCQSNQDLR